MNRLVTQVCDKAKWCGVAKVFCLHLLTTPNLYLEAGVPSLQTITPAATLHTNFKLHLSMTKGTLSLLGLLSVFSI